MNTAEHHSSMLHPWTTTHSDHSAPWIHADALVRDRAAGTRALQVSLPPSSSSSPFTAPYPSPSALLPRRRNPLATGAASKPRWKSRSAAKRLSPTTYISADAANFREMVEWVTGLWSDPPAEEAPTVRSPAMQKIGSLTLDTSAQFLAPAAAVGSTAASDFGPVFPTLESWGVM